MLFFLSIEKLRSYAHLIFRHTKVEKYTLIMGLMNIYKLFTYLTEILKKKLTMQVRIERKIYTSKLICIPILKKLSHNLT